MEFVDIAGLVKGASEGEGLGNKFLANIREVDAIAEVVRVFDNDKIIHVYNKIDPSGDVGGGGDGAYFGGFGNSQQESRRWKKKPSSATKRLSKNLRR